MQQVKNLMSFLPQPCFDHGLLTLSIIILMLKHCGTFSICNLCHAHVHLHIPCLKLGFLQQKYSCDNLVCLIPYPNDRK